MNFSEGSMRKSAMNELCEDRKEHEAKAVANGGWLVRAVRRHGLCVRGRDGSDEMNATTTHESIAKTLKWYPDRPVTRLKAGRIQQWKANLIPDNIVCKRH